MRDEYKFVPAKEFDKLEQDLNELRANPVLEKTGSKHFSASITQLQNTTEELLSMFRKANEDLTLEQREEKILKEQLQPVFDKLNQISDQNETIASALVTISQSIDDIQSDLSNLKKKMSEETPVTRPPLRIPVPQVPVFNQRPDLSSGPPQFDGGQQQFSMSPPQSQQYTQPQNSIPPMSQNQLNIEQPPKKSFGSLFSK